MEEYCCGPSSPTTVVVNSPRRTLSLVRRNYSHQSPDHSSDGSPSSAAAAAGGAKPAEVYGFVGSITTVIATVIYLVWAYIPEPCLHSLGITYYPNKYWALAVPSFVVVTIVSALAFYVGLNFLATPPPTSFSTIFDEHSRERQTHPPMMEGEEKPIEPISDIAIDRINNLMFGQHNGPSMEQKMAGHDKLS